MTNVKSHCSVRTRSSSLTRRYPGTEAAPLATFSAAVNELRVLGGAGNTVVLRPGRNALHVETLEIGPTDVNNLTIMAYPAEMPWASGAVKLDTA